MNDIQTTKELLVGLRQKKKNLRADEAVFLKLSGINEEIEKAVQDKAGFEEELTEAKKVRDDAKKRKAAAVGETTSMVAEKMNAVLPSGSAVFTYDEDEDGKRKIEIGWLEKVKTVYRGTDGSSVDDITTPYNGLSGGQGKIFDAALANVLDANIIVVEAAELDESNLFRTLVELADLDKQVIVNTCHPINNVPEPFKLIEV